MKLRCKILLHIKDGLRGNGYKVVDRINLSDCYLWVLHPVAYLSNWFFMTPSIATKFQYINSLLFSFYSLHVSAPTGHPQVRYTISYYFCF
jgi:hypothetical protein